MVRVHGQIETSLHAYGLTVQEFRNRVWNGGSLFVFRVCEVTELRQLRKLYTSLPECKPVPGSPGVSARFVTATVEGVGGSAAVRAGLGTMMTTCRPSARSNLFRQVFKASGPNITASSLPIGLRVVVLFTQSHGHVREHVCLG